MANPAIGHRSEFTPEQLAGKHVDGLTGFVFETEEDYLEHISPVTGHKPTEIEHLGPDFLKVSEAALQRGTEQQLQTEQEPVVEQPYVEPQVQPEQQ